MLRNLKADILSCKHDQQNLEKYHSAWCSLGFYALPTTPQKKSSFPSVTEKGLLLQGSGASGSSCTTKWHLEFSG